jgi:hypothetical protein
MNCKRCKAPLSAPTPESFCGGGLSAFLTPSWCEQCRAELQRDIDGVAGLVDKLGIPEKVRALRARRAAAKAAKR